MLGGIYLLYWYVIVGFGEFQCQCIGFGDGYVYSGGEGWFVQCIVNLYYVGGVECCCFGCYCLGILQFGLCFGQCVVFWCVWSVYVVVVFCRCCIMVYYVCSVVCLVRWLNFSVMLVLFQVSIRLSMCIEFSLRLIRWLLLFMVLGVLCSMFVIFVCICFSVNGDGMFMLMFLVVVWWLLVCCRCV